MIHQQRGKLLQIAPRLDPRGDFENRRGPEIELSHPARDLGGRGRLLDGVRGKHDGFAYAPRFVEHRRHGPSRGQFDIDGFDMRQQTKKELTPFLHLPRDLPALGRNPQREQHGMFLRSQGRLDFLHRNFFGQQGVDANFHRIGGNLFSRETTQPGEGRHRAQHDGMGLRKFHDVALRGPQHRHRDRLAAAAACESRARGGFGAASLR